MQLENERFDPGSYRDPDGRVFHHNGMVFRTVASYRREEVVALVRSKGFRELMASGLVLDTEVVKTVDLGLGDDVFGNEVLKQKKIPFVSYPNEWSFEMLRQAALCTLEIIKRSLDWGYILKDATAFNIVFEGSVPKFVDILSFTPYQPGAPWQSYGQFCRSFLFPLLISSYRRIDLRPWLLTQIQEITPTEALKFFSRRDMARPGVFKDVYLAAKLESVSTAGAAKVSKQPIFAAELIKGNLERLTKIITGLESPYRDGTEWSDYANNTSYADDSASDKMTFVEQAIKTSAAPTVLDIGCNTGVYSRIAAQAGASRVLSLDGDLGAVDRLFKTLRPDEPIYPFAANLAAPTPATGWALKNRPSLLERIKCDFFLALAVIHHLRVSGCIPFEQILDQLADLAPAGIIEWVEPTDSMSQQLMALRESNYPDFNYETFITLVRQRFKVVAEITLKAGMRRLLHVVKV